MKKTIKKVVKEVKQIIRKPRVLKGKEEERIKTEAELVHEQAMLQEARDRN